MELGNWFFGNSRGKYPVDRNWQNAFVTKLWDMGFDSYGCPKYDESEYEGEFKVIKSQYGDSDNATYFENDTFVLMPYYWGDDEKICELPNFVHKPSGFELSWYKYALCDAYMNKDITFDYLMDIMNDCKRSIGVHDQISYTYEVAIKHIEDALYWLKDTDNEKKTKRIYKRLEEIIRELKNPEE